MATKKKTWVEKRDDHAKDLQVKRLDKKFADMPENSMMLIATPKILDAYIRQIPKGKEVSIKTMRNDLAVEHKAEVTCPVTSGIFLRIVGEAAHEEFINGKSISKITPFWRVVEPDSALNKKFTFGENFVKEQRKKEGLQK
jgi:hypothetical protein